MSHVGSLNCSKEEGLLKLNLASKTLKFSGTNLLPPAVVGLSRCQEGINGEESVQKRMLSPFVLLCDGHLGCPDMGHTSGLDENKTFFLAAASAVSQVLVKSLGTRLSVSPRWVNDHDRANSIGERRNTPLCPCTGSSTQEYHGEAR